MDVAGASTLLVAAAPVMAAVAIAVRVRMGSPVFYLQDRCGYEERPFRIYKFRTMRTIEDPAHTIEPDPDVDASRTTPLGHFLRQTSLDELPQLLNVLRGEMSLVGPRPLYLSYLDAYSPRQRRRHEAPPGITGWAQINGRGAAGWGETLARDVWYVEHRSVTLDLKILLETVGKVWRREGAEPVGSTRFEGEQAPVEGFEPGEPR